MVVAAEIHTATHFCAWNIVIPTATCPLASAFVAKLYHVHHSCRGWRIQTSYWSIMMLSGRVKLPTTIDRRREWWMSFPSLSPNHCYVMCSIVIEPVIGEILSPSAVLLEYKNHGKSFTLVYTLDVCSWQTNRSNWSYPSCDRSRWSKDAKALKLKFRQYPAIHTNYSSSNCPISN